MARVVESRMPGPAGCFVAAVAVIGIVALFKWLF